MVKATTKGQRNKKPAQRPRAGSDSSDRPVPAAASGAPAVVDAQPGAATDEQLAALTAAAAADAAAAASARAAEQAAKEAAVAAGVKLDDLPLPPPKAAGAAGEPEQPAPVQQPPVQQAPQRPPVANPAGDAKLAEDAKTAEQHLGAGGGHEPPAVVVPPVPAAAAGGDAEPLVPGNEQEPLLNPATGTAAVGAPGAEDAEEYFKHLMSLEPEQLSLAFARELGELKRFQLSPQPAANTALDTWLNLLDDEISKKAEAAEKRDKALLVELMVRVREHLRHYIDGVTGARHPQPLFDASADAMTAFMNNSDRLVAITATLQQGNPSRRNWGIFGAIVSGIFVAAVVTSMIATSGGSSLLVLGVAAALNLEAAALTTATMIAIGASVATAFAGLATLGIYRAVTHDPYGNIGKEGAKFPSFFKPKPAEPVNPDGAANGHSHGGAGSSMTVPQPPAAAPGPALP